MTLSRVTKDDIGVICNYVIDELHELGVADTYGTGVRIENALDDSEAWKVETNGTIVAFGAVQTINPTTLHVVSYYIAKPYRQTKAVYLITKKMVELMEGFNDVVYIPLSDVQQLPEKFCKNSRVDSTALKASIERFDKRWEVAQKL